MSKKEKKQYISIKTKLFAVIFLVLVVAVTADSLINIFSFKSAYQKALEEKSYAVGQALSRAVYNNLRYFSLDSFSQMNNYLKSILDANEGISYCFIADKEGEILYHADPQSVGRVVNQGSYSDFYPLENPGKTTLLINGYYESLIPIVWDDETIGTINIGIKQEIINSKIRNMQAQSFIILLLALLFSLLLFYQSLSRIIIVPISKLLEVIGGIISDKEFGRHIEVRHNDEIGGLASLFNKMTDELKKYKEHLEDLVNERTLKLQKEIAERKRVEDQLRQAMQVKSDLVSMVSHELRTPLAAVKTSINMVSDGLAGEVNQGQKELLSTATKNVNRLAQFIDDVLDFQKLEAGKMEFRFKENDLNEVIRDIHNAMLSWAKRKDLEFNIKLDPALTGFKFDRDKITQVLINLIGNSVKFTKSGRITIFTVKKEGFVEVKISDTGIGIEKKDIPKLFRSFEQLGIARSGKIEGTGLGLAICKDIIEEHKGKIWAESEGTDKGTSFLFTLPLEKTSL